MDGDTRKRPAEDEGEEGPASKKRLHTLLGLHPDEASWRPLCDQVVALPRENLMALVKAAVREQLWRPEDLGELEACLASVRETAGAALGATGGARLAQARDRGYEDVAGAGATAVGSHPGTVADGGSKGGRQGGQDASEGNGGGGGGGEGKGGNRGGGHSNSDDDDIGAPLHHEQITICISSRMDLARDCLHRPDVSHSV